MPAQKASSGARGSGVRRSTASSTSTSRVRGPGRPAAHAATRGDARGGLGAPLVDEVVERAEDEVEQVDVVAARARQQPAGERERAGDAVRGRARLARVAAVRRGRSGGRPSGEA